MLIGADGMFGVVPNPAISEHSSTLPGIEFREAATPCSGQFSELPILESHSNIAVKAQRSPCSLGAHVLASPTAWMGNRDSQRQLKCAT